MNKKFVIIAAVIVLVLLGSGAFMVMNRTASKPQDSADKISEPSVIAGSTRKSFRNLFSIGVNQKCTFDDSDSGGRGTVFIGTNKLRGDFESIVNGKNVNSHIIQDGEYMYLWTDSEEQGFMVALDAVEKAEKNLGDLSFDINKEINYFCKPWTVENELFNKPADVEFKDYSKLLEGFSEVMDTKPSGTPGVTVNCAVCDSLTGDAQASCRTALKCN